MRWKGRRRSSNVRDMRGNSGGGGGFRMPQSSRGARRAGGGIRLPSGGRRSGGGGIGLGTLVIIGIVLWFLGVNPLTLLGGLGGGIGGGTGPSITPQTSSSQFDRLAGTGGKQDEMSQFVATILGSTEEIWTGIFKSYGKTYPKPELVLFTGEVRSACGFASAASGPFYCPSDSKAYIDLSFYDQLANQFGAKGDFAQAYVLTHEIGHHVQNVLGILPQFNRMRQRMGKVEANKMSIKVELQADCFAGIWGYYVNRQGWLEEGDVEEGLIAANQVGDDTIQRRTQGYVVPESFNHGTSEQRRKWFKRGLDTGRIESCDTFN